MKNRNQVYNLLLNEQYSILEMLKAMGVDNPSEKIKNLSELKVHVFGHIHEAQGIVEKDGVTYVNASILDLYYEVKNSPVILHT